MPDRFAAAARGARQRRTAVLVLTACLGLAVLGVAGGLWWRAQPPPDVGAAAVAQLASPVPAGPVPSGTGVRPVPIQPATVPTAPAPVIRPVSVAIPALGITATVRPTGVDQAGQFDVPPSVDTVGWYRYGPGLGAPSGSMVIAGHVDSATQGPGAFFRLRDLDAGAVVSVTGSDGRTLRYTVIGRAEYPKTVIDLERYFTWSGAPRLTLITCGGPFDERTHHYRDNMVVTATPVAD